MLHGSLSPCSFTQYYTFDTKNSEYQLIYPIFDCAEIMQKNPDESDDEVNNKPKALKEFIRE